MDKGKMTFCQLIKLSVQGSWLQVRCLLHNQAHYVQGAYSGVNVDRLSASESEYSVTLNWGQSCDNLCVWNFCRTTEWTFFWGNNGTTRVLPTANTLTIPWIWIPLCWTLFGSQTYSSPMKRVQTSMTSPQTTSSWGSPKMGKCCIVSGKDACVHVCECASMRRQGGMGLFFCLRSQNTAYFCSYSNEA